MGRCDSEGEEIPRPQLKRLLHAHLKKHIMIAGLIAGMSLPLLFVFRNLERRKDYAAFYKDYDAEAAFERMRSRGDYFQCFQQIKEDEKTKK